VRTSAIFVVQGSLSYVIGRPFHPDPRGADFFPKAAIATVGPSWRAAYDLTEFPVDIVSPGQFAHSQKKTRSPC